MDHEFFEEFLPYQSLVLDRAHQQAQCSQVWKKLIPVASPTPLAFLYQNREIPYFSDESMGSAKHGEPTTVNNFDSGFKNSCSKTQLILNFASRAARQALTNAGKLSKAKLIERTTHEAEALQLRIRPV